MMSKKVILPTVLTVSALTFGIMAHSVKANGPSQQPWDGLAARIATKFGLNQSEVETVVTEYQNQFREERQQEVQTKRKEQLDALVSSGKLTAAQEEAIIAKEAELRLQYNPEGMAGMTWEERAKLRDKKRAELESWAKDQGIDLSIIYPAMGGMMGRGMRGR